MSHLRDMDDLKETFDAQLAPSGSGHVTSDPAISLVDDGLMRIDSELARNGTTAGIVDTIVSNRNLVSSCVYVYYVNVYIASLYSRKLCAHQVWPLAMYS